MAVPNQKLIVFQQQQQCFIPLISLRFANLNLNQILYLLKNEMSYFFLYNFIITKLVNCLIAAINNHSLTIISFLSLSWRNHFRNHTKCEVLWPKDLSQNLLQSSDIGDVTKKNFSISTIKRPPCKSLYTLLL